MAETTTTGIVPEERDVPTADVTPAVAPDTEGFTPSEEMELNVSADQLSYICEYCGKVNAISSPSCVRCGKRRPRSEYVNAMNRLKNAQSVKNRYIEEQAKLATDRQEAAQEQLVRLVESRVADEKAQIMAQEAIRLEQETDNIKRATARDAVLRVIAAERAADERVKAAELETENALKQRNREAEEAIAAEREKVLYAAAKRVVSERAGIENAAEERILAERKHSEYKAQETIEKAVDDAERNAARRAALKIIAGEQAADDRTRLERDAIHRAALDRINEERRIAEMNAYSRYRIEKEAMERAVDERIAAEREFLNVKRAAAQAEVAQAQPVQPQTVQPLAIVPYVNSAQPLYQYRTVKQVYRFVPDEAPVQEDGTPVAVNANGRPVAPAKPKKDGPTMWLSLIAVLLGLVLILVTLVDIKSFGFLKYIQGERVFVRNIDIFLGLIQSGNRYGNFAERVGDGNLSFLPPLGLWVMLIGAVLVIVSGIIGVVKGKAPSSFFVYAIVALVGAIATYVGLWLIGAYDSVTGGFASIGLIIILAVSVLLLIFTIICFTRRREKREKKKAKEIAAEQPAPEVSAEEQKAKEQQ